MRVLCPVLTASLVIALAGCSPSPDDAIAPDNADATDAADISGTASGMVAGDTPAAPRIVHYECEGTPVDASFDGLGQVSVAVDGANFVLRTEDGAQGSKYIDEDAHVLWIRGEHTLLTRPDRPDRICTGNEASAG